MLDFLLIQFSQISWPEPQKTKNWSFSFEETLPQQCFVRWSTFKYSIVEPKNTLRLKSIRPFAVYSYKFVIFDMFKKCIKLLENLPILLSMLEYIRNHSPRDLGPKFTVLLKIQAFKVRIFQLYLIKGLFFGNFDFEGWYFLNQLKFFSKTILGDISICSK